MTADTVLPEGWASGAGTLMLNLSPIGNDPQLIQEVEGQGHWSARSCDPAFLANLPNGQASLKPGWYFVTVAMKERDGHLAGPRIYIPEPSGDCSELRSVEMHSEGESFKATLFVPRPLKFLRFDPSIYPCEFTCGPVQLVPMPAAKRWMATLLAVAHLRAPGGRVLLNWFRKGIRMLFTRGPRALAEAVFWTWERHTRSSQADYGAWVRTYTELNDSDRRAMTQAAEAFDRKPLVSIITPVYNTPEPYLRAVLESVIAQTYGHWELCLADDASTAPHVRAVLEEYRDRDPRIKVTYRATNGHISAASNSALALAAGEFIALLDHDDALPPDALHWVVKEINDHPDAALIYSDEDKLDFDGKRAAPYFKCDWNYDLFLSHNLITHLGVYRSDVVRRIGGFREGFEGSQDYDLALRFIEKIEPRQIRHIPRVLYHWRMLRGSTSIGAGEKNYAAERARLAIEEHLRRLGVRASVETIPEMAVQRVRYDLQEPPPLASIIIPTRNARQLVRQCIESIRRKTTYANYEILLVDNGSDDKEAVDYFESLERSGHIRLVRDPKPFNFSRINNGAARVARGEYLVFLNNDVEVITPDWLSELVSHAQRREIGAVGARLWYPNDTIQHAGLILVAGLAGHAHLGKRRGDHGYFSRASLIQSLSAVTAACLCVRKRYFEEVGGFDEDLAVAFNDVDLCLRLGGKGYRSLYTPYAELYHHESASRGYEDTPEKMIRFKKEAQALGDRWMPLLLNDPYYSPNLALVGEPFTLAWPPRVPRFQSIDSAERSGGDKP